MSPRLSTGRSFPEIAVERSDGTQLVLPNDLGDVYKVLLFFRGSW